MKFFFFFFPYYHTGGAEKVHTQIVDCFSDQKTMVFFTDRSRDTKNKKKFKENARCINFWGIGNKINFIEKILIWIVARKINSVKNAVVFGSNSRFFYKLLPKLNKNVKVIDLIHWLDGKMGDVSVKNTGRIDERVVITKAIKPILVEGYKKFSINEEKIKNVRVIQNCVSSVQKPVKSFKEKIKILYIGRNTKEKRAWLVKLIWEKLKLNNNFEFKFIGRGLSDVFYKNVVDFIKDDQEINKLYQEAHVIILTSKFEGFPCVFMEAMNHAVVPVSTNVGGISEHLKDGDNAILIENGKEEDIIDKMAKVLLNLNNNRSFLEKLSDNAYKYATNNFKCENFKKQYKDLIKNIFV